MNITITPLTSHTGAEIRGINFSKPISSEIKTKVNELLAQYSVLVFKYQNLSAKQFQEAGQVFGDILPQMLKRFTLEDYPLVGFVSSEDKDRPGGQRLVRGEQYHTDHSNFTEPPKATALCAVEIPSHGGDTQFVNVHAAYDGLPDETKRRIDGLKVLHVYKSSRSPRKKAELTEEEKRSIPETVQPLVLVHPGNGRKALYLNTAHMERIIGMDDAEAFALIEQLMQHATQPKYEYRHKWERGDMVIWDNRSVLHQANGDYDPAEKRYLYRLMVKGERLTAAA
ncbi:MAG TPA: TauD/TfdA family dioxygenase [Nitrospira sp.]|nr:TauD/TfdA family dioxygenase [Nitrospira sp.]